MIHSPAPKSPSRLREGSGEGLSQRHPTEHTLPQAGGEL